MLTCKSRHGYIAWKLRTVCPKWKLCSKCLISTGVCLCPRTNQWYGIWALPKICFKLLPNRTRVRTRPSRLHAAETEHGRHLSRTVTVFGAQDMTHRELRIFPLPSASAPALWDHLRRVIFSRAFLFSAILLCKKRFEKGWHMLREKLKARRCKGLTARPFVTFTFYIKISYCRAWSCCNGRCLRPCGNLLDKQPVLKCMSSNWFAVTAAWSARLAPWKQAKSFVLPCLAQAETWTSISNG